jgi:hypothetical protein
MPSYKVVLNDEAKTELRITADDLEMDGRDDEDDDGNLTAHDGDSFFNFTKDVGKETSQTVAAIPFKYILYIVS